jgi:hypothetical protein
MFASGFGLCSEGGSCRGDVRAVRALESVLDDGETPPGNWWPVGKEALAMLASEKAAADEYRMKLAAERQQIIANPNATSEDRRWAASYSYICDPGPVNAGARVIALG